MIRSLVHPFQREEGDLKRLTEESRLALLVSFVPAQGRQQERPKLSGEKSDFEIEGTQR